MEREMGRPGDADEPDAWGAGTDVTGSRKPGKTATDDAHPGTVCAECGAMLPVNDAEGATCLSCGAPIVQPLTRDTDAPAPPG